MRDTSAELRDPVQECRTWGLGVLFVVMTVVDLLVSMAGPVAFVVDPVLRVNPWIFVAATLVAVALPLQCLTVLVALRQPMSEHRRLAKERRLVDSIIRERRIRPAYQPIFAAESDEVLALEALSRFDVVGIGRPDVIFDMAERVGRGRDLELLAIEQALAGANGVDERLHLSLNLSPRTLADPRLLTSLTAQGVDLHRIILEITEHDAIHDYLPLIEARHKLAHHGVRLAVDDAGSGYASFRHIYAFRPDIIKIDRELISGIDKSPMLASLVGALVTFAEESQTVIVAEGVETQAERSRLVSLKVHAVQGYLTGRPSPDVGRWQRRSASPHQAPPSNRFGEFFGRLEDRYSSINSCCDPTCSLR